MKYSIAVVSVFAAAAYAVPQGSADLLSQIPQCAQPCALNNIGTSGCSLSDLAGLPACLCKSSAFQTKFADCAKSSCGAADQCTLYTNSVAQCKAANVPVTVPSPAANCGGSGGSSSAAGGGQETPAPSPSAPAASPPPAESSAAATAPAATVPAATGAPAATGNGTAPAAPTASAPTFSNGAGSLVLSGGAALFAAVLAVAAL